VDGSKPAILSTGQNRHFPWLIETREFYCAAASMRIPRIVITHSSGS